jgi:hypothetical protein
MLILVILAAWIGFVAARKRQKWYHWAAIGLAASALLNVAVFLPFDLLLGDKEYDRDLDIFAGLFLVILNIAAGAFITSKIPASKPEERMAKNYPPAPEFEGVRGASPAPGLAEPVQADIPERLDAARGQGDGALRGEDVEFGEKPEPSSRPPPLASIHSRKKRIFLRVLGFRKVAFRRKYEAISRSRRETLEGKRPLGHGAARILSRL